MLLRFYLKELQIFFMHFLCGVIILFNTGLGQSAFSTYSFVKLVFCLFVFSVFSACSVFLFYLHKLYKVFIIIVFIDVNFSATWFSLYKKQFVNTNTYTSWKFGLRQNLSCFYP